MTMLPSESHSDPLQQSPASTTIKIDPLVQQRQGIPSWRFWLPMVLQLALLLPIPMRNAYVAVAGETIVLETMAVDPYDIFRGYSQTLAYRISDSDTFESLPGYEIVKQLEQQPEENRDGVNSSRFYVLLAAPKTSINPKAKISPPIWQPVAIVRDRPSQLPDNQIALQARSNGNAILYNLERYYMPEDRREEINQTIQELQSKEIGDVKVEAKVDRWGKAVLVSLWLGDRRYQF